MVNVDTRLLQAEIESDLSATVSNETSFRPELIPLKVKGAIQDIILRRGYPAHYTERQILDDLNYYKKTIFDLALFDYNHDGADFESSHSENSVNRSWISRDDLLKGVQAFVKCF